MRDDDVNATVCEDCGEAPCICDELRAAEEATDELQGILNQMGWWFVPGAGLVYEPDDAGEGIDRRCETSR